MKCAFALLALGLLAPGCCSVSGQRTLADGTSLRIEATRFLWASEGINSTVEDANGLKFTLAVQKSTVDNAALATVVNGFTSLVSASKPVP